tara:strand:+ start:526 stop:1656 length:1131 start_codon:yes stop_codon:yes gene_type:complete
MVLGISEDYTIDVDFDSELTNIPSSGLYVNSGVHPSITNENLLEFLPKTVITLLAWSGVKNYTIFSETRNKKDLVASGGKIYQSIKAGINQDPSVEDSLYWLETNMNSLRLKNFIEKVKDRVYTDLSLNKRLINNQFLYDDGDIATTLLNDYAGWVIEPKGSDYVSFRINQISIQKSGTTPINLYILNQKTLVKTITITPSNGELNFVNTDIVLTGKGVFKLVIDSTDVFVGNKNIDPKRFDGFVAYTTNGTGVSPESSKYTYSTFGNGIGLNITPYLDSKVYIDNNLSNFGSFVRATFEYMCFQMFMHNSNNSSNRVQRIQMANNILVGELKDTKADTVVKRYMDEKKKAITMLEKTFDTQLKSQGGLTVEIGSL